MAKEKKPPTPSAAPWLPMLLVGVATVGVMFLLSGGDDEAEEKQLRIEADEAVVVQPVAPRGEIVSASWRTGVQPEEESEVDNGVDWSQVGAAGKKNRHRKESLERLMKNFNGLAVQVAPEDDKEAGAKR